MFRVTVLVSGGGTNLQALIDAGERGELGEARVTAVISSSSKAYALERARLHEIPARSVERVKGAPADEYRRRLLQAIDETKPDLVVLAGFLTVLPETVVQAYENKIINIHPSLIPSFCGDGFYGLKVHEAALSRGVRVTGATVHYVDCGTDTGPIILQKAVEVQPGDTPQKLQLRVMQQAEWKILPEAVRMIAAGEVKVADGRVCYTGV